MKIIDYTYRHRRDFKAVFRCESCQHETEQWGYDARNFHEHVIPNMECPTCKATSGKQTSHHTIPEGIVL